MERSDNVKKLRHTLFCIIISNSFFTDNHIDIRPSPNEYARGYSIGHMRNFGKTHHIEFIWKNTESGYSASNSLAGRHYSPYYYNILDLSPGDADEYSEAGDGLPGKFLLHITLTWLIIIV